MNSGIKSISSFAEKFKINFINELKTEPELERNLKIAKKSIINSEPHDLLKAFYTNLQFGDFLINKIIQSYFEDRPSSIQLFREKCIKKPCFANLNKITEFLKIKVPDFIPCERKTNIPLVSPYLDKLFCAFYKSKLNFDILNNIKNDSIPEALNGIFELLL